MSWSKKTIMKSWLSSTLYNPGQQIVETVTGAGIVRHIRRYNLLCYQQNRVPAWTGMTHHAMHLRGAGGDNRGSALRGK